MTSIGPDTRLDLSGLDRIGGRAQDELRQPQGLPAPDAVPASEAPGGAAALPATDAGEDILNAGAWDGVGGERLLAGDPGLEARLGALDLAQAADHAADAILDALA